jgi:hypothetical protein
MSSQSRAPRRFIFRLKRCLRNGGVKERSHGSWLACIGPVRGDLKIVQGMSGLNRAVRRIIISTSHPILIPLP